MPIIAISISLALSFDIFVTTKETSNSFLSKLSKLLIVAFLKLASLIFVFHWLLFICLFF